MTTIDLTLTKIVVEIFGEKITNRRHRHYGRDHVSIELISEDRSQVTTLYLTGAQADLLCHELANR